MTLTVLNVLIEGDRGVLRRTFAPQTEDLVRWLQKYSCGYSPCSSVNTSTTWTRCSDLFRDNSVQHIFSLLGKIQPLLPHTQQIKIFWHISNEMQRYTGYCIWKLLYMFRVVPSPVIMSANNCTYSIWYLSHRYCYLLLSWKSWNTVPTLPR